MAYNLPPPWDPGFAMPKNTRDEGLERRAFVTKQMPRGTYDAPHVGTGGFVVPQYVKQERYGQGTYVTKWQPRGTYNGPIIPQWIQRQPTVAKQVSLGPNENAVTFKVRTANALAGTDLEMPQPYQRFGERAAAVIMGKIAQLAPNDRKPTLRKILDQIDPTLWGRVAELARTYVAQGLKASAAVHMALARSMSTGMAAEIVQTGLSRSAPQPNSLLGLGCYGVGALGDTPAMQRASTSVAVNTTAQPVVTATNNPPAGYTWDATIPPGSWRRLRAGEIGKPNPKLSGPVVVDTRDHSGETFATGTAPGEREVLKIGPFEVPVDNFANGKIAQRIRIRDAKQIPSAWKPELLKALTKGAAGAGLRKPGQYTSPSNYYNGSSYVWRTLGEVWKDTCYWLSAIGVDCGDYYQEPGPDGAPMKNIGVSPSGTPTNYVIKRPAQQVDMAMISDQAKGLTWEDIENGNSAPVAMFKRPGTDEDWGVFLTIGNEIGTKIADNAARGVPNPPLTPQTAKDLFTNSYLEIYFAKVPQKPWYEKLKSGFFWIPVQLGKVAQAILETVADLACAAASSPNAQQAGAAAGVAAGAGAAAGAAGASIAQALCNNPAPPPPPPPPASSGILPVAIVAGGLVLVAALLSKKKGNTP